VKLNKAVPAGAIVRAADVALDGNALAVRIRREMEASAFHETTLAAAQ
jgi:hypothetical protein